MRRLVLLLVFGLGGSGFAACAADAPPPGAEEIVRRMIERSADAQERAARRAFECRRRTVIEALNSKGETTSTKTKEHRVLCTNGVETTRILRIDGRAPTGKESAAELSRERENRERYARRGGSKRRRGPDVIDEALIRRFEFRLVGTETVGGRARHVLEFSPRAGAGGGEIADRVLGMLRGTIRVDAAEYELADVDARIGGEFEVLGGIVASIQKLDFAIERRRLADGTWVDTALRSEIRGRKVFSAFRSRMEVVQDGFVTSPPPAAAR